MAKRGQNEGSTYKRKDGLWCAQVTVQGNRIFRYAKTQRECRELLKQLLQQIDQGLTFDAMKISLRDFMDYWLETVSTSLHPKTLKQYTQVTCQHIVPALGRHKLKEITPARVQAFYNSKIKSGTSHRTVRLIHAVLHVAIEKAVKLGIMIRNPTDAATKPKRSRTEMKIFNEEQIMMLLNTAKKHDQAFIELSNSTELTDIRPGAISKPKYEAMYHLAATTGLRQGEILGLQWSDLNWNTKRLEIKRQLQQIKGQGLVFNPPKSKSGRRKLALGSVMIEKLREHLNLQHLQGKVAGKYWQENNLIFPTSIGTPLGPSNLYKEFRKLLEEAGLPHIRFHDLRHSAATLMLQRGTNPKIVQERLGLAQISIALDTYSHAIPDMQEEVAEQLDEMLTPIEVSKELNFSHVE